MRWIFSSISFFTLPLKYFLITFNWDFSQFLGGALPTYPGLTLLSSLVVIIIFNGGLLGITIYNFNNHNF